MGLVAFVVVVLGIFFFSFFVFGRRKLSSIVCCSGFYSL